MLVKTWCFLCELFVFVPPLETSVLWNFIIMCFSEDLLLFKELGTLWVFLIRRLMFFSSWRVSCIISLMISSPTFSLFFLSTISITWMLNLFLTIFHLFVKFFWQIPSNLIDIFNFVFHFTFIKFPRTFSNYLKVPFYWFLFLFNEYFSFIYENYDVLILILINNCIVSFAFRFPFFPLSLLWGSVIHVRNVP